MQKKFAVGSAFRIAFVVLLLGGIILFLVTRNDLFARFGTTAAVLVFLVWWTYLGVQSFIRSMRRKQYLYATLTALSYGVIALLITYFVLLLLWHMFQLQIIQVNSLVSTTSYLVDI